MDQIQLGRSGLGISPMTLGAWQFGMSGSTGVDDSESRRVIRAARDAGITAFDTAPSYGNGRSERLLGEELSSSRDRVVIASKASRSRLAAKDIVNSCHSSLRNLRTEWIDLYQVHWPADIFDDQPVPVAETMGALTLLQQQGKIRSIGMCNVSLAQLKDAVRYGRIDSVQLPYSLFWRHVEKAVMPYCRANSISVLAYSPLAQGLLTGKFGHNHKLAPGDHRLRNKLFRRDASHTVQRALNEMLPIAWRNGASLAQLALAWCLGQGTTPIVGARTADQIVENAGAVAVELSRSDLRRLAGIGEQVSEEVGGNSWIPWELERPIKLARRLQQLYSK